VKGHSERDECKGTVREVSGRACGKGMVEEVGGRSQWER